MTIKHCKVVEFEKDTVRVVKVKYLVDANNRVQSIETHVHPPYRSILKSLGEIIAMKTHDNIRQALVFHKDIAQDLHG